MPTITVGVGKDHTTIQDAIDAASDSDTIEVYSGTYTAGGSAVGNATGGPINITLRAMADDVLIDGQDTNANGLIVGAGWTVEGFEIANIAGGGAAVAGIFPSVVNVTIRDCNLHNGANRGIHQLGNGSVVERTIVADFAAYGVLGKTVRNCLILRCGVPYPVSANVVHNCTVVVNNASVTSAIKISNSGTDEVINCVVVAFGVTIASGVDRSTLGTEYSNHFYGSITLPVKNGTPDASDVINSDQYSALFEAPGSDNFYPSPESPLIDAGSDLSAKGWTVDIVGRTRPRGVSWDVGAYEGSSFVPNVYNAPFQGAYGLTFDGSSIPGMGEIDLVPRNNGAISDVERLALASVFTWKRADVDAEVPDSASWRRYGFWADTVDPDKVANRGSLLWTLQREPLTSDTVLRLEQYLADAFRWWIEEKIATSVDVQVLRVRGSGSVLAVIVITKPNNVRTTLRWPWLWSVINA